MPRQHQSLTILRPGTTAPAGHDDAYERPAAPVAGLLHDKPGHPYGEVVADALRFLGWTPCTPGTKSALAGEVSS